jgi:hypothetical protein
MTNICPINEQQSDYRTSVMKDDEVPGNGVVAGCKASEEELQ